MMEWIMTKGTVLQALLPFMFKGLWMTVQISLIAIALGVLLGLVLGVMRSQSRFLFKNIIGLYLHLFRGTPYLVQVYIIYFVLPATGLEIFKFNAYTAAIVSLTLYTSSYATEIVASAILTVPHGQVEAARSVGMSKFQALVHVVLPQAIPLTLPPLGSVYVNIIKSTAILSIIGITELTRQGEVLIVRMPQHLMFIYCVIALLYFAYCYPLLYLSKLAEKRFGALEHR